MELFLLSLFTIAIGKCSGTLGLLWSQILCVPALSLAYSIGFGSLRYSYQSEHRFLARILFVMLCVVELASVYDAVKSALELV